MDTLPSSSMSEDVQPSSSMSEDVQQSSSVFDDPQPSTSGYQADRTISFDSTSSSNSIVSLVVVVYTWNHPLTRSLLEGPHVHITNDFSEWSNKSFGSYTKELFQCNENVEVDMQKSIFEIPFEDIENEDDLENHEDLSDLSDLYDPEDPSIKPLLSNSSDPFICDASQLFHFPT